jgi:hypothetical protein
MDDLHVARGPLSDREIDLPRFAGQCAPGWTHDGLLVATLPQPARERQERLLAAAPIERGIDVGDGDRQTTSVPSLGDAPCVIQVLSIK